MEAKMYSTPRCGWCDRVARLLEDNERVSIDNYKEIIQFVYQLVINQNSINSVI